MPAERDGEVVLPPDFGIAELGRKFDEMQRGNDELTRQVKKAMPEVTRLNLNQEARDFEKRAEELADAEVAAWNEE